MVEEEEGHDDEERWRKGNSNYFLTLLGLVLYCRDKESGRVADRRDGEGGR